MYEMGEGVPQDFHLAKRHYDLAATKLPGEKRERERGRRGRGGEGEGKGRGGEGEGEGDNLLNVHSYPNLNTSKRRNIPSRLRCFFGQFITFGKVPFVLFHFVCLVLFWSLCFLLFSFVFFCFLLFSFVFFCFLLFFDPTASSLHHRGNWPSGKLSSFSLPNRVFPSPFSPF